MTEFELLAIPISLVLGLGITKILSGVTNAIRFRHSTELHWFPIFLALVILSSQVQYFFYIWDLEQLGRPWTWTYFGPVILSSILLYLSAGLILPGNGPIHSESLLSDFDDNGRLALIPFVFMHVVHIPLNIWLFEVPLLNLANFLNVPVIALIATIWFSNNRRVQFVSAVLCGVVYGYGILMVWSMPGM